MSRIYFTYVLLLLVVFGSCKSNPASDKIKGNDSAAVTLQVEKNTTGSGGYDLSKPNHTWRLPDQLVEVSGNTWIDANHLVLIEDLHPALYLIKLDDKNATLEKTVTFAETEKDKVDIEDVAIVGNTVYALWSHGVLFKISGEKTNAFGLRHQFLINCLI